MDSIARGNGRIISLVAAFILLLTAACSALPANQGLTASGMTSATATSSTGSSQGISTACPQTSTASACQLGHGDGAVMLSVEPAAGTKPIATAINAAQKSIFLEMYLLTQHTVINALEDAASRGVDVRVMLESAPYGGSSPNATLDKLNAAGIKARIANPAFEFTHAKMMIIDGNAVIISTANFTQSALGGSSYTTNREYIVADTNTQDIQECTAIFAADWNRTNPQLADPNLVVSPINSFIKTMALIQKAQSSIDLEEEEMLDPDVVNALIAAQHRGVAVQVVVPAPNNGSADQSYEQQLIQAGAKVEQIDSSQGSGNLYIHAKDIIIDNTLAYIGSVNISGSSFYRNREIGILIADPAALQQLLAAFQHDIQGAAIQ